MSTLSFNCSHCGQHFDAPRAMAGQSTECPNCKQAVIVPRTSSQKKAGPNAWGIAAFILGLLAFLIASYAALKNPTKVILSEENSDSSGLFEQAIQKVETRLQEIDKKTIALERELEKKTDRGGVDFDAEITRLRGEVDELKTQAGSDKLLKIMGEVAYLTPGAEGYSALRYDLGTLTVSINDVTEFANGSKVTLKFGNPLSSNINGLKLTIDYGEVDAAGTPLNDSAKTKELTFTDSLKGGAWTRVPVVLEGFPASKLGFVRIRDVSHTGIELTTGR
jgi:hypothetical protein